MKNERVQYDQKVIYCNKQRSGPVQWRFTNSNTPLTHTRA